MDIIDSVEGGGVAKGLGGYFADPSQAEERGGAGVAGEGQRKPEQARRR